MTDVPVNSHVLGVTPPAWHAVRGVNEVAGWRIKVYLCGPGGGEPRAWLDDSLDLALSVANIRSGDSRIPVGFCILRGNAGKIAEALLGLWVVAESARLVQIGLQMGEGLTVHHDFSLSSAEIMSFEIGAMKSAASGPSVEEKGVEARYLSEWFATGASQPSIASMRATLRRFSGHWKRGDIDGLMEQMSSVPSYRTSGGARYEGREAVREGFRRMCKPSPEASTDGDNDAQGVQFFGNQSLSYFSLRLPSADGHRQDIKGVDIITYDADGRILVKDAYRKMA